jgi:hypothetical protein
MPKKKLPRKAPAPAHSAPIELSEEEVRAAREGKGTHKITGEKNSGRDYPQHEPGETKKAP